ncbi:MAG: capsid protein [Tirithivirus golfim]|uniref:Capsid protein n=1 Tax=Cressdnaviricota sp. TaxID=2748378 RepID=A0A3G2YT08_9VIRU|nr:MAG: capsid protein [Cressdnaviricota sp.]
MAYGRRHRRRYYRRGSRTLSNRYIYGKKGASAQAKQIASLRNRVNALARASQPEIRIEYNENTVTFKNELVTNVYYGFLPAPSFETLRGNACNLKDITIGGCLEYTDSYTQTPGLDHQRTASVRLLLVQSKAPNNGVSLNNVLNTNVSGAAYELNAYRPLLSGVSSNFRVLIDKTFTISDQHPIVPFKVRRSGLGEMVFELTDVSDVDEPTPLLIQPKGGLYGFWISSGLHWDASYTQQIKVNSYSKVAFTDA